MKRESLIIQKHITNWDSWKSQSKGRLVVCYFGLPILARSSQFVQKWDQSPRCTFFQPFNSYLISLTNTEIHTYKTIRLLHSFSAVSIMQKTSLALLPLLIAGVLSQQCPGTYIVHSSSLTSVLWPLTSPNEVDKVRPRPYI